MSLRDFYVPDQEIWDWKAQAHVKQGLYKFMNSKNFIAEIEDLTKLKDGENYSFVYQRDKGWPKINLITLNKTKPGTIKHKVWDCYVSEIAENTFKEMIDFLTN